jgi:hypothetical protein
METANNNVDKAVELLCQAADEGCAAAASLLGEMCVTGKAPCTSPVCSACKAAYAQPRLGLPARERYTGNPIHYYDRWTDNQCL